MNDELKGAKMLSSGILCMYILKQGSMIYGEQCGEDGEAWIFDAEKSVAITMMGVNPKGEHVWDIKKLSKQFGLPTKVRLLKAGVVFIQDVTDRSLMQEIHKQLSGLILVK